MENKYTPGPWITDHGTIEQVNKNRTIASVNLGMNKKDRSEFDGNSKLIAAAPELLQACKLILYRLEQQKIEGKYPDNIPSEIWTCELFLYNAIKKATE